MKKFLLPILAIGLVVGIATVVWATVIGSPHDLAPEPCAMCHTPHSGTGDYPLWNRSQASQTYTMYNSITFDMNSSLTAPRPPSSLCLVCHNGVASELVNYPGPQSYPDAAYDIQVAGWANLGNLAGNHNLTNDHPISFNYDSTKDKDDNGFPAAGTLTGSRKQIPGAISGTNYFLYGSVSGGYDWFECATCHSVHDLATYSGKGDYQVYFLRNDNTGSTMCLDCHTKR